MMCCVIRRAQVKRFLEHYCKVDALYRIAWRISLRMISLVSVPLKSISEK
jgi:hypothetical protein